MVAGGLRVKSGAPDEPAFIVAAGPSRRDAAVDDEVVTVDEAGFVRCEEDRCGGDVFGVDHAWHRGIRSARPFDKAKLVEYAGKLRLKLSFSKVAASAREAARRKRRERGWWG